MGKKRTKKRVKRTNYGPIVYRVTIALRVARESDKTATSFSHDLPIREGHLKAMRKHWREHGTPAGAAKLLREFADKLERGEFGQVWDRDDGKTKK
jgi:hypothetical protein